MSTSRRTLAPRTPGVAVSPAEPTASGGDEIDPRMPPGEPDPEGDENALNALIEDPSDVQIVSQDPPTAMQPQDIKAYIDQQVAAGIAAGMRAQAQAGLPVPLEELPDQAEIDPRAIPRMVLTKQGYVVPSKMGAVPEHLRNLQN